MKIYTLKDGYAALDASLESRQERETERLEDEMSPPLSRSIKTHEPEIIEYQEVKPQIVKIFINQKEEKKPTEKPKREWEEV